METIFFRKTGSGAPVILLHGFPMNRQVWEAFSERLSISYTVYTPDLPGFGGSPELSGGFTLESVGTAMNQWMVNQGISGATIIGHSMGGYVALEMVRQDPGRFKGLCLFHSTATEDSAEKKESRTKVVKFIDDNGVLAFTSNFIQPLFADQNHPAIPAVRDITITAGVTAVKGYTIAMRDRHDNRQVLADFKGRILLIGGDKDKGIPADSLRDQTRLNGRTSLLILENTGHMGMFEKPEETLESIRTFLQKINQPE